MNIKSEELCLRHPSMVSNGKGWWSLIFLLEDGGYQMILKLNNQAPFFEEVICRKIKVSLHDGAGQLLLEGELDEDGELEKTWSLSVNPYDHFLTTGFCKINYELKA